MPVNTEYLTRLLAWAEDEHEKALRGEPSQWDQSDWIDVEDIYYSPDQEQALAAWEPCGTACCIAGKVALEAGGRPALKRSSSGFVHVSGSAVDLPDGRENVLVEDLAADILGLSSDVAALLFNGSNDIHDLRVLISALNSGVTDRDELCDLNGRGQRWAY